MKCMLRDSNTNALRVEISTHVYTVYWMNGNTTNDEMTTQRKKSGDNFELCSTVCVCMC